MTNHAKLSFEMKESDYIDHPVWTWWDDDSDILIPISFKPYLPEDHDALFIYTKLEFNDRTSTNAVIGLRLSDRKVYLIEFFHSEGKVYRFSIKESKWQTNPLQNVSLSQSWLAI